MDDSKPAGQRPSTTWLWKLCKIQVGSHLQGDSTRKARSTRLPRHRDRYITNEFTARYRAGPESSWLVGHNGRFYRLPGWMCLEDAFAVVLQEGDPWDSTPKLR